MEEVISTRVLLLNKEFNNTRVSEVGITFDSYEININEHEWRKRKR